MGDMDMSPTHKMAGITAASQLRPFSPPEREEYSVFTAAAGVSQERTLVWLLYQSGDRLCCVRFLQLLSSPSTLLAHALPTLGSVNSAKSINSETTGIRNRMNRDTKAQINTNVYSS